MQKKIIIGTRGSELALWQASFVQQQLEEAGVTSEIKIIKTKGDNIQDLSFDKMEGKGFFTKEIEDALLSKETDLAVHSHKDLPTTPTPGLVIAAVSGREDPAELLLMLPEAMDGKKKFSLKNKAVVGTSSARRKSQLLAHRPDVVLKELRGNVPTRIRKLREKEYDAILIASAGVERLNPDLSGLHTERLDPKEFIPAPAQGVLAIQARADDKELLSTLDKINNKNVSEVISIERKVMNLFDGGCQLPLGVYCERNEDESGEDVFMVWSARAETWNALPKHIYVQSKRSEGLAEKIFKKLTTANPCSVFITRNTNQHDFFTRILSGAGYTVNGQALIEMNTIPIRKMPAADWIFFSSKHAVKFFFDQQPETPGAKYAVVGKATAEVLRRYGKKADFIGYSTDTSLTGKQFAATAGRSMILFPQAKGSLRTVQQQFPDQSKVMDMIVYETVKREITNLPPAEVLVFTSPSNTEAFLEKQSIRPDQKIVAMGHATANTLRKKGFKAHAMPVTFDDVGLVQAVFGLQ